MSNNNWLNNNSSDIDFYLNAKDVILVERNRCIKLVIDFIHYNFQEKKNLNILDFGCGNGIVTKEISNVYPNNNFYLLDGSQLMKEKAEIELKNIKTEFMMKTFEEYILSPLDEVKYDVILSSMAIHHLDFINKSRVFSKFYHELKWGGIFINIDVVHPPTAKIEEWEFQMWRNWMNETLIKNGFEDDVGKYDNTPEIYKNKCENKPSDLFLQLEELKKAGFRNVDVFLKNGIFAVYGGTKE